MSSIATRTSPVNSWQKREREFSRRLSRVLAVLEKLRSVGNWRTLKEIAGLAGTPNHTLLARDLTALVSEGMVESDTQLLYKSETPTEVWRAVEQKLPSPEFAEPQYNILLRDEETGWYKADQEPRSFSDWQEHIALLDGAWSLVPVQLASDFLSDNKVDSTSHKIATRDVEELEHVVEPSPSSVKKSIHSGFAAKLRELADTCQFTSLDRIAMVSRWVDERYLDVQRECGDFVNGGDVELYHAGDFVAEDPIAYTQLGLPVPERRKSTSTEASSPPDPRTRLQRAIHEEFTGRLERLVRHCQFITLDRIALVGKWLENEYERLQLELGAPIDNDQFDINYQLALFSCGDLISDDSEAYEQLDLPVPIQLQQGDEQEEEAAEEREAVGIGERDDS